MEDEVKRRDEEKHPPALQVKPLQRRQERITAGGQHDFLIINEDFSQQEVNDILSKFSQAGEKLLDWMIRMGDTGAGGINIDNVDALRFVTVSSSPHVQTAIRDHSHAGHMANLLDLAPGQWILANGILFEMAFTV